MKKKLLLLFILSVGFIVFTVSSVIIFKKEHDPELKILSSPSAVVMIDGKSIGKTPIDGYVVTAGEHMVKVGSWQGKVSAYKNSRTYIDRELGSSDITSSGVVFSVRKSDKTFSKKGVGAIEIITDPIGTIIYLDNDEKGIAPLALEEVEVGEHEISAYSPGFIRRSQKVKVEEGFIVAGEIKLAIDPSYQKVEEHKEATDSATLSGTPSVTPPGPTPTASKLAPTLKPGMKSVKIKDTPTGFLRVRDSSSAAGAEVGRVNPGDTFIIVSEENGWIEIEYEKAKTGWISGQYAERL